MVNWMRRWRRRLRALIDRQTWRLEMDEEMRFHLEMEAEELERQGVDPREAHRAARIRFGGVERFKQEAREARGMRPIEDLLQDLRYGTRRLARRPGLSLLAILMLALGIGATTAIFSLAHQIIIEPLPYPDGYRLIRIYGRNEERGWLQMSVSAPNFVDLRSLNGSFESMGAYTFGSAVLTDLGEPERLSAGRITPELFPLLGIEPLEGRNFLPEEGIEGGENRVVLVSHSFYTQHFEPGTRVTGTTLTLNGEPFTVVGVLPPGEYYLAWNDVYVPYVAALTGNRGSNSLVVTGRLKDDVSLEQARAEMNDLALRILEQYPENNLMTGATLRSYRSWLVGQQMPNILVILMGAVGFVLLVACANLANMLLAQAAGRSREVAISGALGAGKGRMLRQMITESTLLATVGGTLGVLLALGCVDLLKSLDPGTIPRLAQVDVNGWVLLFAFVLTVLVGMVAGMLPALQVFRAPIAEALKEGGSTQAGGKEQSRIRDSLVVVEMALSIALLIGAGLMIRSFVQLQKVETGFVAEGRLVFDIELPRSAYGQRDALQGFFDRLQERVEMLPPVEAVGAVSLAPMDPWPTNMPVVAEGQSVEQGQRIPIAEWRLATPGYFHAVGLTLLRGRVWRDLGVEEYGAGVVISESLARQLWPDEDAVGRRVQLWASPDRTATVIGVVSDMLERGLEFGAMNIVFISYGCGLRHQPTFVVHTRGEPAAVTPSIRAALAEIDPNLPVSNVRTLDEIVTGSMAGRRLLTFIFVVFAAVALVLACAGVYGVIAYSVSRRRPEMAVRVTLGALPSDVVRLIVKQGMKLALLGAGIGILASLGLSQFMRTLLFEVTPLDLRSWFAVTIVLVGTALLSCVVPALRASRLDPVIALREE
jgi:putative ABC transport system permease protein